MRPSKVFLVGLPGSGKSTLGNKIAAELNLPFIDLDLEIERKAKQSITRLFEDHGESHFRDLETASLKSITQSEKEFVMATGGGTPCFFDNMKFMNKTGITLFLNEPLDEIEKRLSKETHRPLMNLYSLKELSEKRNPWYEQASKKINAQMDISEIFKK